MRDEQKYYKLIEMKANDSCCKSLEMNASEKTAEMQRIQHKCSKIRPRMASFLSTYIWCLCIGNYCLEASQNCTATVCKLRYEFATELHTLRNYKTCADAFRFDCICNRTIDVLYIEHPPYIYTDPNSKKVVGLLPGILKEALKVCCFDCTKLHFLPAYKTTAEAIMMFPYSTVIMPWVTNSNALATAGDIFIAAMPTKGVVYVTSLDMSMVHFEKFAASIYSNWPLFCISLVLAIDAGIIVWLLDSWRNTDQFPQDFLHGTAEGLWWAYVSMTTVGYGDKTPKSLPARAFGMLWITIGVSLSGIFTAAFITGMTQSMNDGALSLEGKNVGILNATRYELTIGMREGANIKEFRTYKELIAALNSGTVEGLLLDELLMKHYWTELNRDIKNIYVRMNAIANTATSYGILFSASEDNIINREWGKFLQNFFLDNGDNLAVIVKTAENNLPKKLARIAIESNHGQNSIFNSPEIYKLLFKYIGIGTLILIVLGFAFEKSRTWFKTKYAGRKEKSSVRIGSTSHKTNGHISSKHEDNTVVVLRKKFEIVMREMQENENYDVKDIRQKVLKQVFNYQDNTVNMNGSFVNEFQLEELRSTNGDCEDTNHNHVT